MTLTHPHYSGIHVPSGQPPEPPSFVWFVNIGDEVALSADDHREPLGTVTDIHGDTFGDGPGDTITVLPAAVTLSSGDRYPVADLVLLQRAGQ